MAGHCTGPVRHRGAGGKDMDLARWNGEKVQQRTWVRGSVTADEVRGSCSAHRVRRIAQRGLVHGWKMQEQLATMIPFDQ